jgi:hypothetical protein
MVTTPQNIYAQFQDETASITPFAQSKMGLKAGQTLVKLDTYNIVCVPYRLSMSGAVLIASFSKDELSFFQKYVNGLTGLTLVFQPGNSQTPMKIFARCFLKSVSAMKGRESIGLIEVAFKPCPPDLLSILGDYFMLLDRIKVEFEDYKGKLIPINPDTAKVMGYNNYCHLTLDGTQHKVALFAIASDLLNFLVPLNGPVLEIGKPVQVKLFFQSFQFVVSGSIKDVNRLPNGVQKVQAAIVFSMELVSIIENFRFAERLVLKDGAHASPAPGPATASPAAKLHGSAGQGS